MKPSIKNWLQVFRAPNLFTVPGDPLAGYLLASAGAAAFPSRIIVVLIASLLFYGFGLVLNDVMDLSEDRAERPCRPLPSGAVSKKSAAIAIRLLAFSGLFCSWIAGPKCFLCGCALLLSIIAYNCGFKKIPFVGSLNMGACRGLNVLLGATLAPAITTSALVAAGFTTTYIAAVTLLAQSETKNPAIPPFIGKLIRALILIQAVFCAASGGWRGWVCAAILALALWPLSRIVGRRFYAS